MRPPPRTHSIREFGRGAIAADPRVSPIGHLALVFGKIGAPRVRLYRLLGLPDDVELPVCLDLADHDRLGEVMVGVHYRDKTARRLDVLAIHRLADGVDI